MSKKKRIHRTRIKRENVWGKSRYHLTCTCGFFQYASKGECQRLGAEHLERKNVTDGKTERSPEL